MSRIRRVWLLLVPVALLAAACSSYEPPKRDVSAISKLDTGVRHDCNTILGSSFRGTEERDWFEQNCAKWPAVALQVIPAAPQPGQPPAPAVIQNETPECAAMRGKPYGSEQDRAWFLQNCIRPEAPPPAPAPNNGALPQPLRPAAIAPTPLVNANAAVCDTLRRTANPSDEQRRWYFTYCSVR